MAQFVMSSAHIRARDGIRFSVLYHLTGEADPMPSETFEAKTTAAALLAFETYKAKATETGRPMCISLRIKDGRAPSGWRQMDQSKRSLVGINVTAAKA